MVHNGIEYGDMRLIAEAYSLLLKGGLNLSNEELANTLPRVWNNGELKRGYLIGILKTSSLKDEDGNYGG